MLTLLNKESKEIDLLLAGASVNPQIKEALLKAETLRMRLSDASRNLFLFQERLRAIQEDQSRINMNLKVVAANSAVQRRYLEKLENQESQIEKLQDEIRNQKQLQEKHAKEYEDYLAGLNVR
jgi:hypothetical protein